MLGSRSGYSPGMTLLDIGKAWIRKVSSYELHCKRTMHPRAAPAVGRERKADYREILLLECWRTNAKVTTGSTTITFA